MGETLNLKLKEFKKKPSSKPRYTGMRVDKVVSSGATLKDFMEASEEHVTQVNRYDLRYYQQYLPEIFDGVLSGIRPRVILVQVKNEWIRNGWKPFAQKDKQDNPVYVFQASLAGTKGGLIINVDFNEQDLGSPLLSFGHEDTFEKVVGFIEDGSLIDPAVKAVPKGFCFSDEGKYNKNNCIATCKGCIYSILTRLKGRGVRAFVQLRRKEDSKSKKTGKPMTYINCDGYVLVSTGKDKKVGSAPTRKDETKKSQSAEEEDITQIPDEAEDKEPEGNELIAKIKEAYTDHGLGEEEILRMFKNAKPEVVKAIIKKVDKALVEKTLDKDEEDSDLSLSDQLLQYMKNNNGIFDVDDNMKPICKVSGANEKTILKELKSLEKQKKIFESMTGVFSILDK
jgi:hypothetical protein